MLGLCVTTVALQIRGQLACQQDRRGGGLANEGEAIEVLELPFAEAMRMIARGEIVDGKIIMLLQHAALHVFAGSA